MMKEGCWRNLGRPWLGILLLIGSLLSVTHPVAAQESDPPPRQADRPAPVRTPIVKQTAVEPSAAAPDATQTIYELPVVADAYIASARPDENFGSAALYVGYHNIGDDRFGAERSLLRFDLGGLPDDSVIEQANLRLYMSFATPSDTNSMRIIVRQLNSDWGEQSVTWNREPAWAGVRADTFVGTSDGWYEWDITDLVREWQSGQAPNFGIELIGDERVQLRERAFNARETESNFYPRLIVRFDVQTDDQAPSVTVVPLDEYSARNFIVKWSGTDAGGSGIDYYEVQYRVDGGDWNDWLSTSETSAEFTGGESGKFYEFRARGIDNAGNDEEFGDPEANTTVDVRSPDSSVNPLPAYLQERSFTVSWQGSDVGSSIANYDVRYRYNDGSWLLWQEDVTTTSAIFNAPEDGVYGFEVRATDQAGLVEPFQNVDEAQILVDVEAPFVLPCCWLPLIFD